MCKCEFCKKEIDLGWDNGAVLLTCDGDFACSEECAKKWRAQRDHFLEHILPDDRAYAAWLGVPLSFVTQNNAPT